MNTSTQPAPDILKALTREGVLVHVSVRYWRAHRKLKAQDLGLDPNRVSDRLISLGHKRLLPKEAVADLALVEGRVHAFIEANTFPFLGGLARFLPNARLAETLDKLAAYEREFLRVRDAFLNGYAGERGTALAEWDEAARSLTDNPKLLVAAIRASFPAREEPLGSGGSGRNFRLSGKARSPPHCHLPAAAPRGSLFLGPWTGRLPPKNHEHTTRTTETERG